MSSGMKIGFLGAGKMATALAKGFINAGIAQSGDIIASDVVEGARSSFAKEVGCTTTAWNPEVLKFAKVLVLAVKPDQVNSLLAEAREHFTPNHLLISIAAGVTIARMESSLGTGAR